MTRLCSLPIGGVTFFILLAFLRVPHIVKSTGSLSRQIVRLDPLGTVIFVPAIFSLLLALQWGGVKFAWNSSRIIALFVLAGVLLIAFSAVQVWRQDDATVPPRIIKQRSVLCGTIYAICIGGALVTMLYVLAEWFQAVKGVSAVQSGIDNIPMVLSLVVGAIISGATVTHTGYYMPWVYLCTILMSVGAGLITTFHQGIGHSSWIGFQVLFGFGLGVGMQQPVLAAQTVLPQADVPIGIALMFFAQSLGGAVFVCVAQSLYTYHLSVNLRNVSGINADAILRAGTIGLAKIVPADKLTEVLDIYNSALQKSFYVALAVCCLSLLPALGMEWKSTKKKVVKVDAVSDATEVNNAEQ